MKLVSDQPLTAHEMAVGIVCPVCTQHFGFEFLATVTIKPQRTWRGADGKPELRNPVAICAECEKRGLITTL